MIKVAGLWELGWNTPIMEYELWAYLLQDFGIDEWIMSPVSGIDKPNITEVVDIRATINQNPDITPVYLEENGKTPLSEFKHPKDVMYILGKASFSPWLSNNKKGISVRIEMPVARGGLWPHQAIGIVLYDRMLKNGSNNNR